MKKTLLSLALAASALPAAAYTDCTSLVTFVNTGSDGTVYIALASGINFYVGPSVVGGKMYYATASMAKKTESYVRVRFTASSISCTSGADRTDAESLALL